MGEPIKVQPGLQPPPGSVRWMVCPENLHDCPKGMEYLALVDELQIRQEIDVIEQYMSWETKNHYTVLNKQHEKIYDVFEESNMWFRQCCRQKRGYTMHVVDNFKEEVIRIDRPYKCCASDNYCYACFPCCAQHSIIEAPPGKQIGAVRQRAACCSPCFYIRDENGTNVFSIEGPCSCCLKCCTFCGKVFRVFSVETGHEVGRITRKWNGYAKDKYTNVDLYGVTFPMDLDVRMKASFMAVTLLIDFMHYEEESDHKKETKETNKPQNSD
ncbi:unnamed protein product, partial [Mesorhabditis belari]|uniref:Phospholipid scramblase n=1 Tax=Mesorhabditis belari TaxID=2138241 RepID=A0AAF3EG66_9BILA